jgi:hypothetical protein
MFLVSQAQDQNYTLEWYAERLLTPAHAKVRQKGTLTKLHCDDADAVNWMAFGLAKWTIFKPSDMPFIEQYLQGIDVLPTIFPQVFGGDRRLKNADLAKLKDKFGIQPIVIIQKPSQVVVIPAGCPHQVSRKRNDK